MNTNVLAGPILRRTTKNRVCVWLATSEPLTLKLTVTDTGGNALGHSNTAELPLQHVKLGKHLHVYLLQARAIGAPGYPLDRLLYYSIDTLDAGNVPSPLFSQDELARLS